MESSTMAMLSLGVVSSWLVYSTIKNKPKNSTETSESEGDFSTLHELINQNSGDWQVLKETEDVKVLKKETGDSPVAIIKARIFIPNTTTDAVFEALWVEKIRQSWDVVIKELKVLEKINDTTEIIYMFVESPVPWLVWSREFIQKRCYRKVNGNYEISFRSVNRNEIPVKDGFIRGHTIISGYTITKAGSGIYLDFISQNDIKGQIPPKLINTFAPKKTLDWVKKLRGVCTNK